MPPGKPPFIKSPTPLRPHPWRDGEDPIPDGIKPKPPPQDGDPVPDELDDAAPCPTCIAEPCACIAGEE